MVHQHTRRDSIGGSSTTSRSEYNLSAEGDLDWPFGKIEGIDRDDLRETAYEVFFTACRSSPGFGGKNPLAYYSAHDNEDAGGGGGAGTKPNCPSLSGTSNTKRLLGLKSVKRLSSQRKTGGSNPSSPKAGGSPPSNTRMNHGFNFNTAPPMRSKRPLTSAEIMRHQMGVSEQCDNRLRKTLMRTLVGQMGKRPETIILPLELLRHLKPSEFNDAHEYHLWQRRQLKVLEAGLLLYPAIPIDRSNSFAMHLRDIIQESEIKPIDTGKNSEAMRTLCNCVVSLSWRSGHGFHADACHWADGFPINVHLYLALLHSIFDMKDETLVLDEVDELLELIKKTWSTLGIDKLIHNVCFTWVLFQQYVTTSQTEHDLLCASLAMLAEVTNDVKIFDKELMHVKILSVALTSMQGWSEKRLLDYHENFQKETKGLMENLLSVALSTTKILQEDIANPEVETPKKEDTSINSMGNRVDYYIRSSLRNAFTKILENENANSMTTEAEEDATEAILQLAKETEELAIKEKQTFSPILKKWYPIAAGVAVVTLHSCYGAVLKQYMSGVSNLTNEAIRVLQRAGKLEDFLVQMVVEDSVDCEDGGKSMVREMTPYEVHSTILNLLKGWIDERLKILKECLEKVKETETWNPKSKTEPYAHSAIELTNLAKETIENFFEIPVEISNDLVHDLANGLELLFQDYTSFVASCGSKQNYIPSLPPLTRCSRDSRFHKLWMIAAPCKAGVEAFQPDGFIDGQNPRPSTSRGTQRLYIRLNTLNYLLTLLHSIDKILSLSPRTASQSLNRVPSNRQSFDTSSPSYFDAARSSIQEACQHVSEVAAYRLIFLDSNSVFYDSLYVGDVANARIRPALRILKQNLTLLAAILIDRAQPLAVKEVMKASFEAYLMVLLAGGNSRVFTKSDHEMIEEDFESLKRVFATYGEGLVAEEVVEREAEVVEGVVALMGQSTEQIVEDFSIVACEASGLTVAGVEQQQVPMPPTTGKWNRTDPNTILRVLCHRNDSIANRFLKRTFQMAKRK